MYYVYEYYMIDSDDSYQSVQTNFRYLTNTEKAAFLSGETKYDSDFACYVTFVADWYDNICTVLAEPLFE